MPTPMPIIRVRALNPRTMEIEAAYLYRNHFYNGHDAIKYDKDGMNGAYYSARGVLWEEWSDS